MTARGRFRLAGAVVAAGMLAGCDPGGFSLDGGGAGLPPNAGVERTFSGVALKTFAAPLASVGTATLQSLNYMDIDLQEVRKNVQTWDVFATARQRTIDIRLEAVTPRATLMRVTVDQGDPFVKDGATATEIVLQTADALGSRPPVGRPAQTAEQSPRHPRKRAAAERRAGREN